MCDLTRSSSTKSHTKSFNLTLPENSKELQTRHNFVSTGSQTEVNLSNKRPSVLISSVSVLGLKEARDINEDDICTDEALHHSCTKPTCNTKRESIFSTFSQVISIFSNLSDQISQISTTSSWNCIILMCALTALILIGCFIIFTVFKPTSTNLVQFLLEIFTSATKT